MLRCTLLVAFILTNFLILVQPLHAERLRIGPINAVLRFATPALEEKPAPIVAPKPRKSFRTFFGTDDPPANPPAAAIDASPPTPVTQPIAVEGFVELLTAKGDFNATSSLTISAPISELQKSVLDLAKQHMPKKLAKFKALRVFECEAWVIGISDLSAKQDGDDMLMDAKLDVELRDVGGATRCATAARIIVGDVRATVSVSAKIHPVIIYRRSLGWKIVHRREPLVTGIPIQPLLNALGVGSDFIEKESQSYLDKALLSLPERKGNQGIDGVIQAAKFVDCSLGRSATPAAKRAGPESLCFRFVSDVHADAVEATAQISKLVKKQIDGSCFPHFDNFEICPATEVKQAEAGTRLSH